MISKPLFSLACHHYRHRPSRCPVDTKWRAILYHPDQDKIISGSMFRGGGNVFESTFRPILLRYLKTQVRTERDRNSLGYGSRIWIWESSSHCQSMRTDLATEGESVAGQQPWITLMGWGPTID